MFASFLKQFDKYNDKYGVWVFYLGLFLMIVSRYWFAVDEEAPRAYFRLRRVLLNTGQLLLFARTLLLLRKYPLYVLCCIVMLPIIMHSSSLSGWKLLLYSFLIIVASRDANIKITLRVFLVAFSLILITGIICFSVGWFSDITKHRLGIVPHSYGFTSPNTLAFLILLFILLILHYWNVQKTIVIWITCWTTAIFVGILTLGFTSVFILLLIPVLYYCLKSNSIPSWCLALLPWCCLLVSILLSCYYGPSYGETTFESRFSIPALVYQNHGLSFFGQDYGYVSFQKAWRTGAHPLCVDNAFMHLVLCDGLVIALFVFIFLSHYLYKVGNLRHPLLVSSAVGLILSGLMENIALDAMSNFLLLYYFLQYTPPTKPVQEEPRS